MADICEAVEQARDEFIRTGKMPGYAVCNHPMICADDKCMEKGHLHLHETTSDGEGWCCGDDECQCLPACDMGTVTK